MREIKFRAFLKKYHPLVENKNGEMCEVRNIDFSDKTAYLKTYSGYHIGYREFAEFELMQFTGLQDRSGREIFEGDILKDIGSGDLYEVVFDDYLACFCKRKIKPRSDNDYSHDFLMREFIGVNYEVVGNIYENWGFFK